MIYLDYDILYDIYLNTVDVSGGGAKGVIDKGKVEGILEQVKNDMYYPEIEDKVTYLFFSFNKYHCFQDGNKRIALSACVQFLNFNGYIYMLSRFIREIENISIHVASGKIDKELLIEIIASLIYEDEYSEELKLKIIDNTM
ncbi:MAG: type II toxin-antitoxin system death-on-curing family toxin [Gudongella sp.]|nr:type II toxin-antitoxin system death-on-curing family toxin [Gudongella sp.]